MADADTTGGTSSERSWAASVFGFIAEGRVRRRPSDLVRVVLAGLISLGAGVWASRVGHLESTVYELLVQLPGAGRGAFRTASFALLAVGVAIGALSLVSRRVRLTGTMVLGGLVAAAAAALATGLFEIEDARRSAGLVLADGSVPPFPAAALAVSTAVAFSSLPYLTRPIRRMVTVLIMLSGIGTIYLLQGLPSDVLAAMTIGWGSAALAHLALGSPSGTPSVTAVWRSLAGLGVELDSLDADPIQTWGAVRFTGVGPGGRHLAVRVIGRDATDAQVLANLWQAIWYRSGGGRWVESRLQRVEHEALLLMLAERAGVDVPVVVAAATAGLREDAILVVELPEGAVATLGSGFVPVADATLDSMWRTLAALHDAGITHGDVCPENLVIGDGGAVALLDFSRAAASTEAQAQNLDRFAMLVAAGRISGPNAAVASAARCLGVDGLVELLPLLQPSALSVATRRRPDKPKLLLDALREETLRVTGVAEPELAELRRVSPGDLLLAAATIVGIYLLAGQLASVDDLWGTLLSAQPAWVVGVIVCSQLPQFTSAVTVLGAVNAPLPFARVVMLQFSNGFTGLVGGTAANTALIIRFFQRQGLPPTVAVSSGLLWSVAGFIVQTLLVIVCLIIATPDLSEVELGTEQGGSGTPWILYILVIGVVVGILLLLPRVRRVITLKVRPHVQEIRRNLRGVASEPRKAVMLFGGALGTQVFFALSLMSSVHAYGGTVAFSSVVLTNTFASLVGGLAPVPGGMGITEAGMIAGLTAAGVPQETAVSATLLHRCFTYYLPPIWGWGALRWMRSNDAI